jgi:hypothetical protein
LRCCQFAQNVEKQKASKIQRLPIGANKTIENAISFFKQNRKSQKDIRTSKLLLEGLSMSS